MSDEPKGIWRIVDKVQTPNGVAAVLAVMITGAVCVEYLIDPTVKPPETLGSALSLVLGFYFGSKTKKLYGQATQPKP